MFLFEFIIDLTMDCWFSMMQWIVPKRSVGKTGRVIMRVLVWVFSCVLLLLMIIGAFALLSAHVSQDAFVRQLGMYLLFIPLGISGVQILLGVIVRLAAKNKKS